MKKWLLVAGVTVIGLGLLALAACFIIGFGSGFGEGISTANVPVKVTSSYASAGQGGAAQIRNTGDRELTFQVKINNPTTKKEAAFNLVIAAGQTREIGPADGWNAAPGDVLVISAAGFSTQHFTLQ